MMMPIGDIETLSRVLSAVAALACFGWAMLSINLNLSRYAAVCFSLANLSVVLGDVSTFFRGEGVSHIEHYQSFNFSYLSILIAVFLFSAGMQRLHGDLCRAGRESAIMGASLVASILISRAVGMENPAIFSIFLLSGAWSLLAFFRSYRLVRLRSTRRLAIAFLWPVAAMGVLFGLRVLGEISSMGRPPDAMTLSMRVEELTKGMWAQLIVFLLINVSLIGQALHVLFKKLRDQAERLQNILDIAPLGVAVSTEGIIRFANPKALELLDIKVGEAADRAMVNPADRAKVLQQVNEQGVVRDLEVAMYCPNHTVKDLLATYLPLDYEGKPGVLSWTVDITDRKKDEKRILFNRTVVENSEPMFWADPNTLRLVYANKAGMALVELSEDKVMGTPIPPQFLLTLSQQNMPALLEKLRDARRPMRFETRHVRSDGEVVDIDVSCYVAEDEDRSLIIASMRDITQQKRIERAIRQANDEQTAMFEAATWGIAFIKDWTIVRANHCLDALFGWESGTLVGQSPRVWYGPVSDDGPYADIQRGELHSSTQQLTRKDGSQFWCRISGSAIDANDLSQGSVWMFDDVSQERRASELMREAKELAEDATRMKSDFLANMSHEIRTPMNAIIGMSHLALQTDLNPKQRNYIEKVDSAARNLLGIINDILDFSKIEAGKMRFEAAEFHLEDVMENLADLSVIKAQDKGLELLFDVGADVPTALVGDSLRLGQVLINLVGNAIKFTEKGEITVGVHTVPTHTKGGSDSICLRFEVSDTGVGLSAEQCSKLFSAFSQADASTTRKYGGTGLGLTISKRLVELMNGEMEVQSEVGRGSTFSFTAQFGLQAEQRVRMVLEEDVTRLRILVVDDNARAREIMLAILQSQKFEATAVHSGEQAIAALEAAQAAERPFGLVLMDWMMPELDGLATIQRIRSDPLLSAIPAFVMVTAHSREELIEQAGATKIDGLLLKPIGPSALLDSILCALGKEVVTRGRKQQREQASHEAELSLGGAHVLLVEDNPVNQELALEILQAAGIRVDVANNGAEAIGQVGRHDYDGVLMDCQMPVMDGFEATRHIRADARFSNLPILAMTANAMSGDRELCLAAGMNDHIGKPIDVDQLFATMARWIQPKNPALAPAGAPRTRFAREAELPAIDGLDLPLALRRMGGNAQLTRKLIRRFAQTQSDALERIQTALERGDLDTATRDAHTTKGLAGNIGATQVLVRAGAVETLLKQGTLDLVPPALQALDQELGRLLQDIERAMGTADSTEVLPEVQPAIDRAVFDPTLRQLALLLADDDSRAAKMVDAIAEPLRGLGQGAVGQQLQTLIAKYEFEEALEILQKTAQALGVDIEATDE